MARLPLTDTLTLTQGNVYILPTRAGWMLAATLLILLIASINYQLNLGYLLTFLLAGCAAISMVISHNTLRGLKLHLLPPSPVFVGQLAVLDMRLANDGATPRHAIGVAVHHSDHWNWTDVPSQDQSPLQVTFQPTTRGLHKVPALTIETRFPLGTFRVWAIWRPAAEVLVYPNPEPHPPPLPTGEPLAGSGLGSGDRAQGEFDGVRAYRRGDAMKLVVWKKFAKSEELLSRDATQAQRYELWFDMARTGGLDTEARIARLAAWVLHADAEGLDYGLRLPGTEIRPAAGAGQRLRCLHALAVYAP